MYLFSQVMACCKHLYAEPCLGIFLPLCWVVLCQCTTCRRFCCDCWARWYVRLDLEWLLLHWDGLLFASPRVLYYPLLLLYNLNSEVIGGGGGG